MILKFNQFNETLINNKSLEQLRKVRKLSKKTDIGDKISKKKINKMISIENILDKDIETYEDYIKNNTT